MRYGSLCKTDAVIGLLVLNTEHKYCFYIFIEREAPYSRPFELLLIIISVLLALLADLKVKRRKGHA